MKRIARLILAVTVAVAGCSPPSGPENPGGPVATPQLDFSGEWAGRINASAPVGRSLEVTITPGSSFSFTGTARFHGYRPVRHWGQHRDPRIDRGAQRSGSHLPRPGRRRIIYRDANGQRASPLDDSR